MNSFSLKQLFVAMVALLCSVAASAHDFAVDGIFYNITSSSSSNLKVQVTYKGNSHDAYSDEYTGSVVIPESVTYNGKTYSVTSIGAEAFYNCSGLTSVTIGNRVKSIGIYAFRYCVGLTSVTIPNSVTSIGNYAFFTCIGLTSVTIGSGVTSIGRSAFEYCKVLTSVTIGNSVISIGERAFCLCDRLTNIIIPNSVTSIGESAFSSCSNITKVRIGNSVTSIGSYAFSSCSSLTSVTIPNSVTNIGDSAFYSCYKLKKIINLSPMIISEGSSSYGYVGYYANNIINLTNGSIEGDFVFGEIDGVNTLGGYLGDATELVLPENYKGENYVIGDYAFSSCSSLTSVTIPNSVTSIGDYAFSSCSSLTSFTIPNSVTSIGEYAFSNCSSLTSVTIPNSVTSIGERAFLSCRSLTSVTIPNSVTSIGESAFYGCSGLTSVTIGNGVTSIGESAFKICSSLENIVVENGNSVYDSRDICNAIVETATNTLVHGCKSTIIPNSVTSIGKNAFESCSGLTSVTIPNSVTSIGERAFLYCHGLTSVTIPNSVTSIGEKAFYGCSGLTSVSLNYKRVSDFFGNNSNISEIVLGENVIGILDNAFGGYSGLKSIKCINTKPPKVASGNFTSSHYQNVVLYVPKGSLDAYQDADVWKEFWEIVEFETTDIEDITDDAPAFEITAGGITLSAAEGKAVAVYSAAGALVEKIDSYAGEEIILDKGVYIVRVGNKAVKVKL